MSNFCYLAKGDKSLTEPNIAMEHGYEDWQKKEPATLKKVGVVVKSWEVKMDILC